MSKQQINRRPPASPFSLARTEVLKAPVQDLLSPPRSPLLIQHLDTAILSQGQGASSSALADQYSLLAAILKRLAALVRQPDSMAMVWPIVEPFIQDRLALIGDRLWNGVETSLTGASQCVENLVSLSRALSGTTDDASSSPLLSALFQRALSSTLRTKASVQILTAVLPSLPTGERLQRLAPDLLDRLLARSMDRHLVLQQGKLLAAYLAQYLEGTTEEDACLLQNNLAQRVVRQLLVVDGDSDDADDGNLSTSRTNLVQQALPPLLPVHSTFLRALLAALDNVDGAVPGREEASLALLALASRAGLCTPVGEPLSDEDERKGLLALPLERLRLALAHPSLSVRLAALTLVAERSGTGVCLVEGEIALVKEFLEGDISVNENEARNPIVIRIQKILLRVRSSSNTVVRSIIKVEGFQNLTAEEERSLSGLKERLARSKNFVQWLADFLTAQLRPGATFPRTLLSLRLLRLLTDLGAFIDVTPSPSPSSGATATQSPLTFPFDIRFFTVDGSTTQRLLRTLLSTFPELRVFALELLERATPRPPGLETPTQIQALERAALEGPLANPRGSESHAGALAFRLVLGLRFGRLASGGQVDVAGQVQFVESLLDTLDARLALARGQTLLRAAASEPLHGFLQALQEILALVDLSASSSEGTNPWPAVFSRARKTVGEVWDRTRDVLSSSVEGELAEGDRGAVVPDHEEARTLALLGGGAGDEGDEVSAKLGLSHQVILSWAWRAIKEAAALLATLFTLPLATKDQVFWTALEVDSAGKLFLALLTEIRHPGAFLAIYPAYVSLVASLVPARPTSGVPSMSIPVDLAKLPARWLDRSLEALNVQHHTAGRRSAGLPFAVLSVLQGDPSLAAGAFDRLLAFSSGVGQSAEVRVTGMNTLQVVLSDARFAHLFPRFFEQAVILSLDALTSTDWAVRNAGLLLMGSLLRKAFTQKTQQAGDRAATANASTGALFGRPPFGAWFGRYPRLLPLFLERLESFDPAKDDLSTAGGSIFAVLQALSNLQASDTSGDTMVDASQQAFERALRLLVSSRQLDIREAAAYSLPAVVPRARLHATLCEILSGSLSARQNERHGRLLQLEVLLRQVGIYDDQAAVRNFSRELAAASGALLEANRCAPTAALYLDVVRALVEGSAATEVDGLSAVHAWCERYLRKLKCSKDSSITGATREPGADRLDLAAARLVLARLRQSEGREPSIAANLTGHFLRSSMEEVCEVALLQVLDASDNDVLRSQTVISESIAALAFDRSASQRVRQAALACLGASSFSSSSSIPAGLTWEALVEDYTTSTVQPFKELVLPLLGALIVAKKDDFLSIEGRVERWLAILEETSDEAQSNDFRSASILSLSLAPRNLLFPSPSSFSSSTSSRRLPYALRLRTQALVLRLLQDDSSHIRALAAQLAGSVVALRVHGGGGMAGAAARAAWWRFMEADVGGSGGEEQSWIAWLVARLIDDGEDKAEVQHRTAANKGAVLFEKERPNFFIEPELDIVSASLALGRAVQGQPGLLLSLPPQKQRVEEEEEEEEEEERGFAFFVEEKKEHLRALRRKGLREAVLATA